MTFTQNQTRQVYVALQMVDMEDEHYQPTVGDIQFVANNATGCKYLLYVGPSGQIQRTDLIKGGRNLFGGLQHTIAADMARTSTGTVVTLDPDLLVNNTSIINGQDYLLNIHINQYYFKSDIYDTWKHGVVHGAGNMTASDFYARMAMSAYSNFSREPWPILKFGVTTTTIDNSYTIDDDANITWIDNKTKLNTLLTSGDTYTALVIDEEPQDWRLGKMSQEPVLYDVHCDYITYSGDDMIWGEAKTVEGGQKFPNSKLLADMEWFYHGERGDIYRENAYPSNFDFHAFINPYDRAGYDTIDIHYYWHGANHAVQKSEKDITIIGPK